MEHLEILLDRARRGVSPLGSTNELQLKHLLTLNLRKLGDEALTVIPRSYILQSGRVEHAEASNLWEFAAFEEDFKVSHAVAVLQRFVAAAAPLNNGQLGTGCCFEGSLEPEGLWGREAVHVVWRPGPDPSRPLEDASVEAAFSILRLAVVSGPDAIRVGQELWESIEHFSPLAPVLLSSAVEARVEEATDLLAALPHVYQPSLVRHNLWILKPCSGMQGRGVMLLDRLPQYPQQLLQWTVSVGRAGFKASGDEKEGCVLQKLIETPGLLDRELLLKFWPPGLDSHVRPSSFEETPQYAGSRGAIAGSLSVNPLSRETTSSSAVFHAKHGGSKDHAAVDAVHLLVGSLSGQRFEGVIVSWLGNKGFGFIQSEALELRQLISGKDLFFHGSQLSFIREGLSVSFEVVLGQDGRVKAEHLCPVHGESAGPKHSLALQVEAPRPALFKYNLRLWMLASLGTPPAAWLYRRGYVDLAPREFTAEPDPASHVTNLLRGDRDRGRGHFQRHWPLEDYAAYLARAAGGEDIFERTVLPRAQSVVRAVFRALQTRPSSLAATHGSGRLKRFGLDLLVDESMGVWLIEVNLLKDGYGLGYAVAGPGGDLKRHLVDQLLRDEATLRDFVRTGMGTAPKGFDNVLAGRPTAH